MSVQGGNFQSGPYNVPNVSSSAAGGTLADLENYPLSYLINAAAQTGGKINIDGKDYDFTGLGSADTAAQVSDQVAQALLDIQKNQSSAFIQQRLAQLKAADPTGYAARQRLFDSIMAAAQQQPDRPLAQDLQNQIVSTLNNAGQLDARGREQISEGVRGGQIARGIILGNAPVAQEAGAQVQAADELRNQQQQQALQFLQSGVSPEDVAYRRMQQTLSDLGNFTNGQSPTAQFRSLSAAGNGAVPIVSAPNNPAQINPNAAGSSLGFNSAIYSGNVNWQNSQVNPWMVGVSGAIGGLNVGNAWQQAGAGQRAVNAAHQSDANAYNDNYNYWT